MGLPRKANIGEIIRVDGYEGRLFLVTEYSEEKIINKEGSEEIVTYTVHNIDNMKEVCIVFDEDVLSIVATADKAREFMLKRKRGHGALPPAIQPKKPGAPLDVNDLLRHFEEAKERQAKKKAEGAKPKKKPLSEFEKKRQERKAKLEYVDYLLDIHSMIKGVNELIGEAPERNEELLMIEEEFQKITQELKEEKR